QNRITGVSAFYIQLPKQLDLPLNQHATIVTGRFGRTYLPLHLDILLLFNCTPSAKALTATWFFFVLEDQMPSPFARVRFAPVPWLHGASLVLVHRDPSGCGRPPPYITKAGGETARTRTGPGIQTQPPSTRIERP